MSAATQCGDGGHRRVVANRAYSRAVEAGNLGAPSSYLAAFSGISVVSDDDVVVGSLMHVLAAEGVDALDGIIIEASVGGGGARFVDAVYVAGFYERAVTLRIDSESCADLPRPHAPPAVADAAQVDPSGLAAKLRRAWEVLSGGGA